MDLELSSISFDKRSTSAQCTAPRLLDINNTPQAQKRSFLEPPRHSERNVSSQLQELGLGASQLRETVEKQGHPGGKKARAVVVAFATVQERLDVLGIKASLGKNMRLVLSASTSS